MPESYYENAEDPEETNQEPAEIEEKDFNDLYEEWTNQKKIYRWEGETGVENFEKLVAAIGYSGNQFKYGSPIESFLCDNPGAIEALIEWITDHGERSPEWRSNLESELEEESEEEGDDGDFD